MKGFTLVVEAMFRGRRIDAHAAYRIAHDRFDVIMMMVVMAMTGVIAAAGLRFRGWRVFSGTHQPSL
jgi:hypothetical protein